MFSTKVVKSENSPFSKLFNNLNESARIIYSHSTFEKNDTLTDKMDSETLNPLSQAIDTETNKINLS